MAITVEETETSRALRDGYEANQKSIDLEFACWDMAESDVDPVTVRDAVEAKVLASPYGDPLYGLRLQTITLDPLTRFAFLANVHYGVYEPPKIDQIRFGFTTAGGTEHITHSLSTIANYAATGMPGPPNHHNAINVTNDGPQGTQRLVPQLAFWVTGYFDPDVWTAADWLNVLDLSGTWNNATWHGWPAKYVLFEHCEAPEIVLHSGEMVPVKFYFKAGRPEAVTPAPGISFTKDPWDYVWPYVVTRVDSSAGRRVHQIQSTHREQLYKGSDFALLGLG